MKMGSGNYVQGANNIVGGSGNVVLGSENLLVGINSWCFTSDYSTPSNKLDEGVLAVGNYRVVLSRANQILDDPRRAVSMIDSSELDRMKHQNVAVSYFFR